MILDFECLLPRVAGGAIWHEGFWFSTHIFHTKAKSVQTSVLSLSILSIHEFENVASKVIMLILIEKITCI